MDQIWRIPSDGLAEKASSEYWMPHAAHAFQDDFAKL